MVPGPKWCSGVICSRPLDISHRLRSATGRDARTVMADEASNRSCRRSGCPGYLPASFDGRSGKRGAFARAWDFSKDRWGDLVGAAVRCCAPSG